MSEKRLPTWPLWLLAAPAGVAIWSGWVGLGGMTGFGPVTLLPGISDLRINTAITLPVGMEVYAAYALRAWLGADVGPRARNFARRSAVGALVAGAAGQIAYHLMAAAHWREAPWPVTIAVSCVPVAVLGMGAALAHLLREPVHDVQPTVHPEMVAPEPVAVHMPGAPAVRIPVRAWPGSAPPGSALLPLVERPRPVHIEAVPMLADPPEPRALPAAARARVKRTALAPDWRICGPDNGDGCGQTLHRNTVRLHRQRALDGASA